LRRIEATSLVKYHQVDSFWTNYSQQFTGGKWNYKNLFTSDSSALYGANYAITLVYAHEIGHYMRDRFVKYNGEDYTCEEVIANECLAAFACAFNDISRFDTHKENFIKMARQTYEAMPDSVKTSFDEKTADWCAPNPMKAYFDDYFTNEPKFLRLYGYSQLRMMEHALKNYNGQGWNDFLQTRFYRPFAVYNNTETFQTMPYSLLKEELLPSLIAHTYENSRMDSSAGKGYRITFTNAGFSINNQGDAFACYPYEEKVNDPTKQWMSKSGVNHSYLVLKKALPDTQVYVMDGRVSDTVSNNSVMIYNTQIAPGAAYSQVVFKTSRLKPEYIGIKIPEDDWWFADTTTWESKLVKTYLDGKPSLVRTLPDVLFDTTLYYQQSELLCINGANGLPLFFTNAVAKPGKKQILQLSHINPKTLKIEEVVFETALPASGFIEVKPATYYQEKGNKNAVFAFASPVTEKIYVIRKEGSHTKRLVLQNKTPGNPWGQQMQVTALRLIAPDKMYVLATSRKAGNTNEKIVRKLLIELGY
jgi:hypothetical protein